METKICRDCGKELSVDMFHFSDKKKGVLKSYCKDCSYDRVQAHIAEDPIAFKHYQNRYYRENPEKYPGNHITKSIPTQCGVYKISCVLTNDFYIGCSNNIRDRIYKHRKASGRGKQQNLYKLIQEYGWEAFDVEVLEQCDRSVVFERETYWINHLQPNLNKNQKQMKFDKSGNPVGSDKGAGHPNDKITIQLPKHKK